MDVHIKELLLDVVSNNLPKLQLEAIRNLIEENEKLATDRKYSIEEQTLLNNQISSLVTSNAELTTKLENAEKIISEQKQLINKATEIEQNYRVLVAELKQKLAEDKANYATKIVGMVFKSDIYRSYTTGSRQAYDRYGNIVTLSNTDDKVISPDAEPAHVHDISGRSDVSGPDVPMR